MQDGLRDDVLDGAIGNGGGFRQRVDAAALLEGFEECGAWGHGCVLCGGLCVGVGVGVCIAGVLAEVG